MPNASASPPATLAPMTSPVSSSMHGWSTLASPPSTASRPTGKSFASPCSWLRDDRHLLVTRAQVAVAGRGHFFAGAAVSDDTTTMWRTAISTPFLVVR